ncbi:hypothetical protein MPS_0082 [Mycobacterium pseudoshottsii JCM 15466]|nr:hypothetical protein MMSP_4021 [Mycobacterium sp. 012931]GAQ31701.1 hypothetical protein MPS_0082 [Mycobacterium pseudoshottsii JCM 15466]
MVEHIVGEKPGQAGGHRRLRDRPQGGAQLPDGRETSVGRPGQ